MTPPESGDEVRMVDRSRVTRHGGELAQRLAGLAAEAARGAGLDPALLGDYPRALVAIAQTRRRLTKAELDTCRARSVTAAERGVSLQSLIGLYLTVTRRLWPHLPAVAQPTGLPPCGRSAKRCCEPLTTPPRRWPRATRARSA
jgi:hypothetical protein